MKDSSPINFVPIYLCRVEIKDNKDLMVSRVEMEEIKDAGSVQALLTVILRSSSLDIEINDIEHGKEVKVADDRHEIVCTERSTGLAAVNEYSCDIEIL